MRTSYAPELVRVSHADSLQEKEGSWIRHRRSAREMSRILVGCWRGRMVPLNLFLHSICD